MKRRIGFRVRTSGATSPAGDEMLDDFADPHSRRARLAVCKSQLEEKKAR